MLKVAVLGAGFMGGTHARAFAKATGRAGRGCLLTLG